MENKRSAEKFNIAKGWPLKRLIRLQASGKIEQGKEWKHKTIIRNEKNIPADGIDT